MHLPAVTAPSGLFELVRLDEAQKLAELMGATLGDAGSRAQVEGVLRQLVEVAQPAVSGLVVDSLYSWPLVAGQPGKPPIFRLNQQTGVEVDPLALPTLQQNWNVEAARQNYGLAFLELYYHPGEEQALRKKQLVAELSDYARHEGIDFVLSLIIYTPASEEFAKETFQAAQLQAIQELREAPQLLVLQYPQDALAAATVTAELDIPWVLSDAGIEYDAYKEMLRDCLESGAGGFLAGEVLWRDLGAEKDAAALLSPEAIDRYFTTTARDRILELVRITEEYEENV